MEKNIHDDRLDDYVRKSFEDYEEDPASDMWGRIEEVLPPVAPGPVIGPGKPSIRRYFWQMSAAAAILLLISSLVCGRMYYENKIRDISEQQNKPENSVAQPAVQGPYPAGSGLMAPDKMKTEQENAGFGKTESPSPSSAAVPVPSINSYVNTATEKPFTKPQALQSGSGDTPVTSASVSTSALPSISSGNKSVPERNTLANAPLPQTPESLQPPTTVAGNDITPVLADSAAASTADFVPINDFQLLETKKSSPLSHTFAGFKPLILPVQPLRQSSSWYVGVQVSPILMVEKKGTERPATLRPRLVSAQEKTSFTADYWLKAGKQLQGRWGFETGIGYREIEKNAAHRPRFRFMNGRPGGNAGNHARNYDFDYDLDTYGGSSEVTLRMVQVDSNIIIPEDEPLQFQINTSERVQLLRIPALLTARVGQGRLTGMLKAGLVGNIVLRNEIEIVTRVSENTRFRPGEGSNAYTLRPDKAKKFFPGYQVSAGLEYRPSRHFSWVLEPAVAGEFARKNSAGRQLPSLVTIGVNAGMNYYF